MSDENKVTPIKKEKAVFKKWDATEIQNDLIEHVAWLSETGRLDGAYPDVFGVLKAYRPYEADVDAVLLVDEEKQVRVMPHHDLDHFMGEWYRQMFRERYHGTPMSRAMQAGTTRALIPYLSRLSPGDIKIFCFRNEKFYSWRKLDWQIIESRSLCLPEVFIQDASKHHTLKIDQLNFEHFYELYREFCPSWFSIMQRMKNTEAFCAWMGSLMDRDCDNHQFLFLRGEGGDGKGTIIRMLNAILSDRLMFTANIPEEAGAKRFFTSNLEGKRVLACPEHPSPEVFTAYTKSLSGGDPLNVERKGKDSRNAENHLRIIFASNHFPKIPDTEAARRRIILVPMDTVGADNVILNFEAELVSEAQIFFSISYYCFKNMPKAGRIEQDMSVYAENFDSLYGEAMSDIEKYFTLKPVDPRKHMRDNPHMSQADFTFYCRHFLKHLTPSKVRELLEERHQTGHIKTVEFADKTQKKCVMGVTPSKELPAWALSTDRS